MRADEIILMVLGGLGVIHGLFLAILLITHSKGNQLTNKLLSCLLIILSFRIGKSVFLEFANNLGIKITFMPPTRASLI